MSPSGAAPTSNTEDSAWARAIWAPTRLGEAVEALSRASGLASAGAGTAPPDEPPPAVAARLGLELHAVHCDVAGLKQLLRSAPPFLLPLGYGAAVPMLAVIRRGLGGALIVLGPDGRRARVPVAALTARLLGPLEAYAAPEIDALLDEAGLAPARRARARERLLAERLATTRVGAALLLRAAPWSSPLALARDAGLLAPALKLLGARALGLALGLASWVIIGGGALSGQLSPAWVGGWALLGLTGLVIGQWGAWQQGQLALRGGAAMKRLLLRGAMNLDPEHHRRQGSGGSLARVSESQAIEDLVLSGGLNAVFGALDLLVAAAVLWLAPAGPLLVALFGLCLIALALATARGGRLTSQLTEGRLQLAGLLVERMVGHRTRLAQAHPERRAAGEDEALAEHHLRVERLDRHRLLLHALLGGGFTVLSAATLGAVFVSGALSAGELALGVGGVLLAQGALMGVNGALDGLIAAAVSWRAIAPLAQAARAAPSLGDLRVNPAAPRRGELLLRAQGLRFTWPGRARPTLDGAQMSLYAGDRALISGPSGGGKSTLAALLSGQRAPDAGLLLLRGLDLGTFGEGRWRGAAVAAPQFHENYVFTHSLAFNLLLGGEWPAEPEALDEARALLEELGLGPLLMKMPAGLAQFVGESGWQLSHGERSRVYLARALLQGADLVILDESFAALDPATLRRCLEVAHRRAATLIVIAHP